jgi:hypothetical protein
LVLLLTLIVNKAGAYPSKVPLLALLIKIKISCKGLPGPNTVAHGYSVVIGFITGPGPIVIKVFTFII